jgi:hypothetical protein
VTIATNGTIQPLMDENKCKIDPTNRIKISIVAL